MSTPTNQGARQTFHLVQIPTSRNVVIEVTATSVDEVRAWAMSNVDTSTRWIIKLHGQNLGDAIVIQQFTFDTENMRIRRETFNSMRRRVRFFDTATQAADDYKSHLPEAGQRLAEIEQRLVALKQELAFEIDYAIEGDAYGLHHDALFVSVNIAGYEY